MIHSFSSIRKPIMTKYQADLTLCRLSAIAIAKHLWVHTELRGKLESCINSVDCYSVVTKYAVPSATNKVMKNILVPEAAKEELRFAIGSMGGEMLELFWRLRGQYYEGMTEDNFLFVSEASTCMDYICWRADGSIHASKTVRSLYFAGKLRDNYVTWEMLCIHCLGDCIIDLWLKLGGLEQYNEWRARQSGRGDDQFTKIVSAYWIGRIYDAVEDVIYFVPRSLPPQFYNHEYSLQENMFMYSLVVLQDSAVRYFWRTLDENQRRRTIGKISENIMSDDESMKEYKGLFFAEKGLSGHLIMFFLQQLSRYGSDGVSNEILGSGFVLSELLEWPYDNVFMEILRESSVRHSSINYSPIVLRILVNICWCREFQFTDVDVKYRRIFYRIWEMNPNNLKSAIDYKVGLKMLWYSELDDLLNYIFRDEELQGRRKEFLDGIAKPCEYDEISVEFCKKFLTAVLVSEEERSWFCRQIAVTKAN